MPRLASVTARQLAGQGAAPRILSLVHTLDNPNAWGSLSSPEARGGEEFGSAVAISGNNAIVGAPLERSFRAGVAYIFNVTTGALIHTLNNPSTNSISDDQFGNNVAIDGNYAIVGVPREDDANTQSGKAYIFNVTTGALVHTIDNPNAFGTSQSDNFGTSVSISGDRAIVGASSEDDDTVTNNGKAYIFNVTTGALVHTLDNPDPVSGQGDFFGFEVGISGDRAIVGALNEDDGIYGNAGKAYIFNVTTGALIHTLDNPNDARDPANDKFGEAVAIYGNYAAVGVPQEEITIGNATSFGSGVVYVYNVTTGDLLHTIRNPNAYSTPSGDSFGKFVALHGSYGIFSAWGEDDGLGSSSGKAYVFNIVTGDLIHTIDNPNAYGDTVADYFGWSVSIFGNRVIVGARLEEDPPLEDALPDTNSGKAYIFSI